MKSHTRVLKAFLGFTLLLSFIMTGCIDQVFPQSGTTPPPNQGFLPITVRDIFALFGFLALIEKFIRAVITSIRSGLIRSFYRRYIIPFLLSRAFEKEAVDQINHLLEDIALGKLRSDDEEVRKIGINELAAMPPSKHILHALIVLLDNEKSKRIRHEIVQALNIHIDFVHSD